ncbi:MAG: histidine phosphatase family protein [Pseudomonadota bacterium]
MTRHLWIIRHAKSSWQDPGTRDHERPLNARGERDGARMAAHLVSCADPPQWLFTSTARRAAATARFVQQAFDIAPEQVIALEHLYHASAQTVLTQLQETPAACNSVALVAHNPGLTDFVNAMAAEPWLANLPTFGTAHFQVSVEAWHELRFGTGTLTAFFAPKQLPGAAQPPG